MMTVSQMLNSIFGFIRVYSQNMAKHSVPANLIRRLGLRASDFRWIMRNRGEYLGVAISDYALRNQEVQNFVKSRNLVEVGQQGKYKVYLYDKYAKIYQGKNQGARLK